MGSPWSATFENKIVSAEFYALLRVVHSKERANVRLICVGYE